MRMTEAADLYIREMTADGRFNSPATDENYRATLTKHAEDVGNRDPSKVGRDDVKKTLQRWAHPNTRTLSRSHLVSFYDWCVESGIRKDNPARQTRRPRKRKPTVYRLTRDEVRAFRAAARGPRERAMVDFGQGLSPSRKASPGSLESCPGTRSRLGWLTACASTATRWQRAGLWRGRW